MIAAALLLKLLMTLVLGPNIRWILYQCAQQNVLQIQHCSTP